MKYLIVLLFLMFSFPCLYAGNETAGVAGETSDLTPVEADSSDIDGLDEEDEMDEDGQLGVEEDEMDEEAELEDDGDEAEFEDEPIQEEGSSFVTEWIAPARFTLKHEYSYKTSDPQRVVNNRSSARVEYSKFFGTYFFIQFDTKVNFFLAEDHRAKAEEKNSLLETNAREAFLQVSFGETSIKAGIQVVIWGESDGGAITDVVSPRDNSEFLFISLEESRIGQALLMLDQYSGIGTWSLFYIPEPEFDKMPAKGTEYDFNPFDSLDVPVVVAEAEPDIDRHEYGLRWKKTFGKSDIALMVADLMANQYSYEYKGFTPVFNMVIEKAASRYQLYGLSFNYAKGSFLWKGEIAGKTPRIFNNEFYGLVEKDVLDTAFGLEYSPSGSYILAFLAVNSRVVDWEESIVGIDEDVSSLIANWSKSFLNEDLSITMMASHTLTSKDSFFMAQASYAFDDRLKFEFEATVFGIDNEESQLWTFKDQNRATVKVLYQF